MQKSKGDDSDVFRQLVQTATGHKNHHAFASDAISDMISNISCDVIRGFSRKKCVAISFLKSLQKTHSCTAWFDTSAKHKTRNISSIQFFFHEMHLYAHHSGAISQPGAVCFHGKVEKDLFQWQPRAKLIFTPNSLTASSLTPKWWLLQTSRHEKIYAGCQWAISHFDRAWNR